MVYGLYITSYGSAPDPVTHAVSVPKRVGIDHGRMARNRIGSYIEDHNASEL